jgi:L-fuculose-phosphate aldolase
MKMEFNWRDTYARQVQDIIEYSEAAYQRGLVSGTGGNISTRCGEYIIITATNVPLRRVTPETLILCSLDGSPLDAAPGERPSKETGFHAAVYRARPDVKWVAHLHPVYSIVWGLQGLELPLLTESARLKLGQVPIIPVGTPGSKELAEAVTTSVVKAGPKTRAFFMREHGILAVGATAADCYHTCELLEDSAKIAVLDRLFKA